MAKKKNNYPITPAVRFLRQNKIDFIPHLYTFKDHGGTRHAAVELDIPEHIMIKTLVMRTDSRKALLVLMHGDLEVSTKSLARELNEKRIAPCDIETAQKYTGYLVGGISPFGTRIRLPVYAESSIFTHERIYINGGKRGFMVEIDPNDLERVLRASRISVAIAK